MNSICSPAKVGLVVIDLITSPVVSWRGWETPPPPSTAAQLSFFAQPRLGEDLSLCGGLLFIVCYAFCSRLVNVTGLPSIFLEYFLSVSILRLSRELRIVPTEYLPAE